MPETEEHRHRRHRRRRSRSSKSKSTSKRRAKFRLVDILLILWSTLSLISFVYLIDKVESAPAWQIIGLAVSTLVGLFLFFRLAMGAKK